MKREYLYRWRITIDVPVDTFRHYTLEDFQREFPGDCVDATLIEVTEWVRPRTGNPRRSGRDAGGAGSRPGVKTKHRYLWRVIDRGKTRVTKS